MEANKNQPEGTPPQSEGKSSVIPVIEETIQVGSKVVESEKLQISKKVNEEEVTVNVPTVQEEVTVERVTINKYVESAPTIKQEGDTTIIPILKEVLVVEKRLMLVEEVHVIKRRVETKVAQKEILRKEEVFVKGEDRGRN